MLLVRYCVRPSLQNRFSNIISEVEPAAEFAMRGLLTMMAKQLAREIATWSAGIRLKRADVRCI